MKEKTLKFFQVVAWGMGFIALGLLVFEIIRTLLA